MTTLHRQEARRAPAPSFGDALPRADRAGRRAQLLFAASLLFLGILTVLRVAVLFLTRLELYPDEAQYWLWSRRLALGYFSKPPMIAWLIRGTTALGGQSEPWVRLSAPLLHGLAAAIFALAGRRLGGAAVGAAAGLIYGLCPGVDLSSAVIATDAPLMLWLSLALLAYAVWWTARSRRERGWAAAAFGASLGLAFLAKYAALYFAASALLHPLLSAGARSRWRRRDLLAAVGLFLALASPNLLWNAAHHFETVAHTAADADLGEPQRLHWFDPRGGLGYLLGQWGVFGPIPFLVLAVGVPRLWVLRRLTAEDGLLLIFALPPLTVVFVEAVVARANANWAGSAYGPAAILAALIMVRRPAPRLLAAAILSQAAMAAIFMTVFVAPALADRASLSNSFKRARGWAASAAAIQAAAARAGPPLTAVVVDDRFLFNALAYYARDAANRPAGSLGAPLRMWVREARPHNQAETAAPLSPSDGERVLAASAIPQYRSELRSDFTVVEAGARLVTVRLDVRHARRILLFTARGYRRRPRDPATGRPMDR